MCTDMYLKVMLKEFFAMRKNILLACCLMASFLSPLFAADGQEGIRQKTSGRLSFSYNEKKEEYVAIESRIRNTLKDNSFLQTLLDRSLQNGDLKVVLDDPLGLCEATYIPSERSIFISSKPCSWLDELRAESPDLAQQVDNAYKTKCFMFELGNSLHTSLPTYAYQYPDADAYAFALATAEATSREIIREAVNHEYRKGGFCNVAIFAPDSQKEIFRKYQDRTSLHYQIYVRYYNDNFFENKFWYYSRKPVVYIPLVGALSWIACRVFNR